MSAFVIVAMSMRTVVTVVMPAFVGMAADFHIAAAETATAFFAHKIVSYCSSGRQSAPFFLTMSEPTHVGCYGLEI